MGNRATFIYMDIKLKAVKAIKKSLLYAKTTQIASTDTETVLLMLKLKYYLFDINEL